ncbi:putative mannan endo-1,6-alpha-mannosidase [Erysiphe neolycopersici]|uniref:Putative mannan endo-1,6-alpha-mannosidase n=1 Tax=Erysiphe neolycopersici TaxID=212602 RepID=A0A420HPL2_9PEZI|nr:putative mannan endo-1,6-alpha-mannosidase [Erysiphe neolycopersici]
MLLSFAILLIQLRTTLATSSTDFISNSRLANTALSQWYNSTTGVWDTTGCAAFYLFENTFEKAPKFNEWAQKKVESDYMIHSLTNGILKWPRQDPTGFLNGFYDDEGWWALGWIQAYDVTKKPQYLQAAVNYFNDMDNATTTPCNGGIWWDRKQTYVNAIANELYLSVAAHLANRAKSSSDRDEYRKIAVKQWNWFQASGMINNSSNINDGLTADCKSNNGTVWSYNQGVILGGLVELSKATSDESYLRPAMNIAVAATKTLSDKNGVLHDPCEPNCGNDGTQFKGIFLRNLQVLQQAVPDDRILSFITLNAASIWTNNRNQKNQFGVNWAGPFIGPANASTQSSGLDAIVAASSVQGFF